MVNAFDVWMSERLAYDEKEYAKYRHSIDTPPPDARRSQRAQVEAGESFMAFMQGISGEQGVSSA